MIKVLLIAVILTGVAVLATSAKYQKRTTLEIIGGNDTDIKQHPFAVSIQEDGELLCGGILISSNWVITAAHCIENRTEATIQSLTVRINSTYYDREGQLVRVEKGIQHADYETYFIENDIALLYLASAVGVDKYASLPEADQEIPDGTFINVTGWGEYNFINEDNSVTLQNVEVPTVNRELCRDLYSLYFNISENLFCAGFVETGGKDFCSGDNGGPAAIGDVVVGVILTGAGCAQPDAPGIYIQLSKYIDWINDNAKLKV